MQAVYAKIVPALIAVLVLLPQARAQETPEGARMMQQMVEAYQAKDYDKAIGIGDKLVALEKTNPTHPYNMACLWALKGDGDKAVTWLGKSVELGFTDLNLMKTDPDLESIRGTAGYKQALAKMTDKFEFNFEKAAAASKPIVIVPDGVDKEKAKVIVALHPYGGTAEGIVEKWQKVAAEAGAVLVAPRAVRKLDGRDGFSWGETDEADVLLKNALQVLTGEHKVKPDKMVLTGFSQGGFMTFNLGLKHADKFCGLIPVAGRYSSREAELAEGTKLRVYMMVGSKDRAVSTNKRAKDTFTEAGVPCELVIYEGLGHAFPDEHEVELKKAIAYAFGG